MDLDAYLTTVADRVAKHGLMVQAVFPVRRGDRPFVYSVGLFPKYGYEVLIAGLDVTLSSQFVNAYAEFVAPVYQPGAGHLVDCGSSHLFQLRQMGPDHPGDIACKFYDCADIVFWQLVWPDVHDVHPGAARSAQTLPGARLDG